MKGGLDEREQKIKLHRTGIPVWIKTLVLLTKKFCEKLTRAMPHLAPLQGGARGYFSFTVPGT